MARNPTEILELDLELLKINESSNFGSQAIVVNVLDSVHG